MLWLIYFEGLSIRETADVMGKNLHTTETLVYRARNALKVQLEKRSLSMKSCDEMAKERTIVVQVKAK